jgi:hypothetical protein
VLAWPGTRGTLQLEQGKNGRYSAYDEVQSPTWRLSQMYLVGDDSKLMKRARFHFEDVLPRHGCGPGNCALAVPGLAGIVSSGGCCPNPTALKSQEKKTGKKKEQRGKKKGKKI